MYTLLNLADDVRSVLNLTPVETVEVVSHPFSSEPSVLLDGWVYITVEDRPVVSITGTFDAQHYVVEAETVIRGNRDNPDETDVEEIAATRTPHEAIVKALAHLTSHYIGSTLAWKVEAERYATPSTEEA